MKTAAIFSATDQLGPFIEQFLPASQGLRMDYLVLASNELTLVLTSSLGDACCPVCQEPSKRVHSRYQRTLQDLPWGHLRVQLHLQVHRFFCENPCCIRKIFTERLGDLAEPYARRTSRLREALLAIGVTVRRLVKERRQEKEARFPQFPVGLSDQGSQVGPALLEEVATPSDQATDMYGIDGNFIASHAAIALFHPPTNCPFASIIGPI